jgi:hypothetical protein
MGIDFSHRLVVAGPRKDVDILRRRLTCTVSRTVDGHRWRERVPFSFQRLYELAPAAVRIERNVPFDPYDLSVWPIRKLPGGRAEIRYRLHTRNMELLPFVRLLSRKFAMLVFYLVTFCLDDDEMATYRVRSGQVSKRILSNERKEAHWERARQKFGLGGDAVYEDEVARLFAEDWALEEALDYWQPKSHAGHRTGGARNWWNRPVARDFQSEGLIVLAEIKAHLRERSGQQSAVTGPEQTLAGIQAHLRATRERSQGRPIPTGPRRKRRRRTAPGTAAGAAKRRKRPPN